jgi:nucleoside-diphosphate-sugar epimerase
VRSGHDVRLLVREPARIQQALEPLGVGEVDYTIGDVTDAATVEQGMTGCDAAVHAASVYSLDARAGKLMGRVNVEGTKIVLSAAARLELDPVVYVSSLGVFYPPNGAILDEQSPVKEPPGPYYRSKAGAEQIARGYQERGIPVITSYPGGVFGPDDPHFGESARLVASIVKRHLPVVPQGGLSVVDVRDLARAHAVMLEPGRGPRRYVLSGTHLPFASIIRTLEEETGRRIPHLSLPGWSLWPAVHAAGLLQRVLPFRLPVDAEGVDSVVWDPHGNDSRARADLGFAPRPHRETLADTIGWLYRARRISARQAGRAVSGDG